ncbi:AAA family ATPase [Actinomycetospora rhizophila]|uniref:AAA family ATPase n=1 Tax=Actinomycetospora rhizophila TaxID=1416876 RepID=A0ABV9ZCL0_9PSEU
MSPGEQARLWPECREQGVIRVGWDAIGDLREFGSDDELVAALEEAYRSMGPTPLRKLARQLLRFRDLPAGARIVANRGTSEVLAVGLVTPDGYGYAAELPEYRHQVAVNWDESYAQKLSVPARGWVPTFNNVSPAQWTEISGGRGEGPRPGPAAGGETAGSAGSLRGEWPDAVAEVVRAAERKGQIVLYGPPGTGKTRLALSAALAMSGTDGSEMGGREARAAAVSEMLDGDDDAKVRMTTFHPSLGYEDFVEGYKPVVVEGGGLALDLTDGVFLRVCTAARKAPRSRFFLIIDEINRADLSRVLGELVTLLERDKREHVTVRLPVSGRPFSVPENIVLIGTMNTADRSVAHIDAAVRRRFAFVEVPPEPAQVEGLVGPLNLSTFLTELNRRIVEHLGADHCLGHAHLLADDLPVDSPQAVADAFYQDLAPQLEDSAAGDPVVLRRLLGDDLVRGHGFVVVEPEELLVRLAKEFGATEATLGG